MKLRIRFSKTGAVRFIGHLDIMRYFQKAMRRAGYDICYSKGYHPHPVMSFASPLGLGLESMGEYMDIEVNSALSADEMKNMLNEQMAEGIEILSVNLLEDEASNSMSAFAAADYLVRIKDEACAADSQSVTACNISEKALSDFLERKEIVVRKKTKKNEIDLDIRPLIYEMYLRADQSIFMKLSAGSSANLKPELVMQALCSQDGSAFEPYQLQITRLEMYADSGTDGNRCLTPLDKYQTKVS